MAKNVQRESKFPGLMKNVPTSTQPTHAHEYEQVHEHEYAPKKEIRSKRLNLIIKPSMSDRLDRYAKTKGISKNNLIENMIEELLSGEGF